MDYRALIQNETTLQHHGIRGMKWGHRKNVNGGSTSSKSERRKKLIKRIAIAAGTTAVVVRLNTNSNNLYRINLLNLV